jgi:hypothetical protein
MEVPHLSPVGPRKTSPAERLARSGEGLLYQIRGAGGHKLLYWIDVLE